MKGFQTWVDSHYAGGQGCHAEVSQYATEMGQEFKKITANSVQFIISFKFWKTML